MGIIRLLDGHVANQIAAGEVVERPASVVKELVENAIDAGASAIGVEAEEGGLKLVRVTDNGHGIAPEDMELAFQRHATSKIRSGRDLFRIATLGFRGEALPSIAAVAKVSCRSAAGEGGLGVRLDIEGGRIVRREEVAASRGTDIAVRELFFNTPARLKYMRTVQTELGHVCDAVYRQALAHPEIAFTLRHNGQVLLRTPGNGDLRQVVAAIYGTAAARAMAELAGEHPDYAVSGLVALPVETRSNRNAVTIVVNGRHVRSPAILQSLLAAYHTMLPVNRYPLAVVHLRMDPSLLDVNVHPSKLEVRFSKETELRVFVEEAVRRALARQPYIPSGAAAKATRPAAPEQQRFRFPSAGGTGGDGGWPAALQERRRDEYSARDGGNIRAGDAGGQAADAPGSGGRPAEGRGLAKAVATGTGASPERRGTDRTVVPEQVWRAALEEPAAASAAPAESAGTREAAFPELHWVGQVHGTYIVAQNESGLFLIDQHAAHERIQYEYFYDLFGRPPEASQELLLPVTLEFPPGEAAVLRGKLPVFEAIGVYLEEFGGNAFIVRSVPHWFPKGEEEVLVREMAEWIVAERDVDPARFREKAAILCACKAAIKANSALTGEAGQKLLERLAACRQPYTCPHGRPIVVSFSRYELDKMFKRVMS